MRIKTIILLVTACLCIVSYAQMGSYRLNITVSEYDFADTVSIEFDKDRVIVPVVIDSDTLRFLFDTGAGQAVVYDDSPINGCEPCGTITSYDAIGRSAKVPVLRLPPLRIGRLTLTGCRATLHKRAVKRGTRAADIDGILGFDIVNSGLLVKIDAQQRQLIITDRRKHFKGEQGYSLRYKLHYHVPYITVEPFKGFKERVLFDTGSRHLYAMKWTDFEAAEPLCRKQNPQQVEGISYGCYAIGLHGTEPYGRVAFLALDRLSFGGFGFCHVHALTTQGGAHVGAQLLRHGAVVLNPGRKRIVFQPYSSTDHCVVGNEQLKKAIINEKGKPVVGLLWERSDAYKAGLRQGDVILKADDRVIDSFADYLSFRPIIGHVYRVIVRDKRGFTKEVLMEW